MGTQMTLTVWSDGKSELRFRTFDLDEVALAAMRARPFTLKGEQIYGPDVADSLLRYVTTDEQRRMCEQLKRLWERLPFRRMKTFAGKVDGTPLLPKEGVWDGQIGDRYLYAEFIHADDERDLLDHLDDPEKEWSLAGVVGDWLAIVSHQEALMRWIRPDLCPSVTQWSGTPQTIFERLGVKPSQ